MDIDDAHQKIIDDNIYEDIMNFPRTVDHIIELARRAQDMWPLKFDDQYENRIHLIFEYVGISDGSIL